MAPPPEPRPGSSGSNVIPPRSRGCPRHFTSPEMARCLPRPLQPLKSATRAPIKSHSKSVRKKFMDNFQISKQQHRGMKKLYLPGHKAQGDKLCQSAKSPREIHRCAPAFAVRLRISWWEAKNPIRGDHANGDSTIDGIARRAPGPGKGRLHGPGRQILPKPDARPPQPVDAQVHHRPGNGLYCFGRRERRMRFLVPGG